MAMCAVQGEEGCLKKSRKSGGKKTPPLPGAIAHTSHQGLEQEIYMVVVVEVSGEGMCFWVLCRRLIRRKHHHRLLAGWGTRLKKEGMLTWRRGWDCQEWAAILS